MNEKLSNMNEEDQKIWAEGVFQALGAKNARSPDNPTVQGKCGQKETEEDQQM